MVPPWRNQSLSDKKTDLHYRKQPSTLMAGKPWAEMGKKHAEITQSSLGRKWVNKGWRNYPK